MDEQKAIDSQVLKGIKTALQRVGSSNSAVIDRILACKAVWDPGKYPPIGQPIHARYAVTATPDEALEILTVLLQLESSLGHTFQFEGRQINFLADSWKWAIEAGGIDTSSIEKP